MVADFDKQRTFTISATLDDMTESQAGLTAPEGQAPVDGGAGVNLQILSPSVGVNTLAFPGLAASTTIGQLKEKIRENLPLRPAADQQRLIHRGRLLARDNETLQDVFGEEAVRSPPCIQWQRPHKHYANQHGADSYRRPTDSAPGCERCRRL